MIEMTPKLCQLAKAGDPETIPGALMEPKLDGHRMVAFVGQNGVTMYARSGVDKSGKLPAVERWLWDNIPAGTILDGEVIDPRKDGGDWAGVQTILGAGSKQSTTLTFVVFDVLSAMGEDVRGYALASRRLMLEQMIPETVALDAPVQRITQQPYSAEAVADLIAAGWEGAIVKDPNGKYRSGSRDWVKIKATETVDVVVMGATAGKGKFTGLIGALRFGQYDTASSASRQHFIDTGEYILVERGQCSGMDDDMRFMLSGLDESDLVGTVIEVQHMGKMPSGGWRHPQFKRLRTDKRAEECVA